MIIKDYFAILGITRTATQSEIRRAYRELARRYHPDFNPNNPAAAERFMEVKEAYHLLSRLATAPVAESVQETVSYQQSAAVGGYDWSRWA